MTTSPAPLRKEAPAFGALPDLTLHISLQLAARRHPLSHPFTNRLKRISSTLVSPANRLQRGKTQIYSQLIRSTGSNLDSRLASEV